MVRRMLGRDSAAECKAHTEKLIASLQAEVDSLRGKALVAIESGASGLPILSLV